MKTPLKTIRKIHAGILWGITIMMSLAVCTMALAAVMEGSNVTAGGNAMRPLALTGDGALLVNSEATVFTSAARTVTVQSADFTNYGAKGVILYLDLDAVTGTSPTMVLQVQMKDPISGDYIDVPGAAFASKATAQANTDDTLTVYPGVTELANRLESAVLPRTWRVDATLGGSSPSFTFSLSATYIQ